MAADWPRHKDKTTTRMITTLKRQSKLASEWTKRRKRKGRRSSNACFVSAGPRNRLQAAGSRLQANRAATPAPTSPNSSFTVTRSWTVSLPRRSLSLSRIFSVGPVAASFWPFRRVQAFWVGSVPLSGCWFVLSWRETDLGVLLDLRRSANENERC